VDLRGEQKLASVEMADKQNLQPSLVGKTIDKQSLANNTGKYVDGTKTNLQIDPQTSSQWMQVNMPSHQP
jgi:hypothetical protein